MGEDPNRPGLKKTPARAAKALLFLTQGYQMDPASVVNGATFEAGPGEEPIAEDMVRSTFF